MPANLFGTLSNFFCKPEKHRKIVQSCSSYHASAQDHQKDLDGPWHSGKQEKKSHAPVGDHGSCLADEGCPVQLFSIELHGGQVAQEHIQFFDNKNEKQVLETIDSADQAEDHRTQGQFVSHRVQSLAKLRDLVKLSCGNSIKEVCDT